MNHLMLSSGTGRQWMDPRQVRPHCYRFSAGRRNGWRRLALGLALLLGAASLCADVSEPNLVQRIQEIESRNSGTLGVYLKHLGTGKEVKHQSERDWYLASLVKVPLAIAVLQAVENNQLALSDQIELKESDFVDGSGHLLFQEPGTLNTVSTLLEQSLEHSDSTATDMLMRRLGVEAFNQQIRKAMVDSGLDPFTTILQVRYDAYQELHPRAAELSNTDYVQIRSAGGFSERVVAFREKLGLGAHELKVSTLEEAFERYYQRGLNSGTLEAAGILLEKLVRGELLSDEHTNLLLGHMEKITTGDRRIQSGLSSEIPFAQKTGTQIERACNMGVAHPRVLDKAVVVVVCMAGYGNVAHAENAFKQVALALRSSNWL